MSLASDSEDVGRSARQALREHLERLRERLIAGDAVTSLLEAHLRWTDTQVRDAWQRHFEGIEDLRLLATGGYGRGELYPRSDVDLLILAEPAVQDREHERIARFSAALWDAGIQTSPAVRSISQCALAAQEDITTLTAMMEVRVMAGDATVLAQLEQTLQPERAGWNPAAYFEAKRAEQRARHARFNDTYENLEPNIKEGPGGLRDLHTVSWMGQRLFASKGLRGLVEIGLLGEDECNTLEREWKVLARLRFGLHLIGSRREERLLFDHQKTLAAWFGLQDEHRHNLAVEQLMQGFFRSASLISRINDRLLQRFEEQLAGEGAVVPLSETFELRHGYLRFKQPSAALEDFRVLLSVFRTWAECDAARGLHSRTARAIAETLPKIKPFEEQSEATRVEFIELLSSPHAVVLLTRMARLGVLARYLPAFGKVVGRMQFDLFHVYTVDQHTLTVLANLRGFATGPEERFSIAHEVYPRLRRPDLLLLAGLFHDIAKGRGGDHSELGALDALEFCAAHGLSASDTELVRWLVEQHLLMSTTAQKQDIADSDVVNRFALKVGDRERLDYLYLLTCADIAGTSPKLWNSWKDRLLADLHRLTRFALRRGLEAPVNAAERISDARAQVEAALSETASDAAARSLLDSFPPDAFLRYRPEQIVWQVQSVLDTDNAPHTVALRSQAHDRIEIFVRTPDQDGLFAALVATIDRLGLDVLDARILNGGDGFALDSFQVQLTEGARIDLEVFRAALLRAVHAPQNIRPAKRATPRRLKHFRIPVQVAFHPSQDLTRMSLICTDRPGLLATVADVLRQQGVRVHDARIATFGERVEDFFLLTDAGDRPLSEGLQAALGAALQSRLENEQG